MFTTAGGIILGFLGIVVIVRLYQRHQLRRIERENSLPRGFLSETPERQQAIVDREVKAFEKDEADGKHTTEWAVKELFGIPYPYEGPAPTKGKGVYDAMCEATGRKVSRIHYWRFLWALITRSERRLDAWAQTANEDESQANAETKARPIVPMSVGRILVILLFFGGWAFLISLLILTHL